MGKSPANNLVTIDAKSPDLLPSNPSRLAKWSEIAVNYVLKRAGIKVELEDMQWHDDISKEMIVVASCGRRVGYVQEVLGDYIKIAPALGNSPFIPLHWVDQVDSIVFLDRDYEEIANRV